MAFAPGSDITQNVHIISGNVKFCGLIFVQLESRNVGFWADT